MWSFCENLSQVRDFFYLKEKGFLVFDRIPMVPVCREYGNDIVHPYLVLVLRQPVELGMDMDIIPVCCRHSRAVDRLCRGMPAFNQVR